MTLSKIVFYCCISFIAGIFIESAFSIPVNTISIIMVLAPCCIGASFFIDKKLLMVGFCLLFIVLGVLRQQIGEFSMKEDFLKNMNDGPATSFIGVVAKDPIIKGSNQKLVVQSGDSFVLISLYRYPTYSYGDTLAITGKLETPKNFNEFDYQSYLMKDRIYSVMYYPEVIFAKDQAKGFQVVVYGNLLRVKHAIESSIERSIVAPESFLLEGILFGDINNMPQSLKDIMNRVGINHMTAVSGSNVVILSALIMSLLLLFGLWRSQAFYVSLIIIWAYIVIIGFPASGVRAGIMGSIFLFGQYLGRQYASSRAIVLAGTLMLLQNSFLLFYDLGFQLSFMASFGIIFGKPIIDKSIHYVAEKFSRVMPKDISDIVSVTISAQLFTIPILLYTFGVISIISLIPNILILPVIPFIMQMGLLGGIVGIWFDVIGRILLFPCQVLLVYFIAIATVFDQSWVVVTFSNVHWIWVVVLYSVLAIAVQWLYKRFNSYF